MESGGGSTRLAIVGEARVVVWRELGRGKWSIVLRNVKSGGGIGNSLIEEYR